ncbi:MAG: hypothetical protein DPW09_29480 [Anaerolineae bacterium]|nr:hypothetical protein [Anaerolineae bacterium]
MPWVISTPRSFRERGGGWRVGRLEGWEVGGLEGWRVGRDGGVGVVGGSKVGWIEIWGVGVGRITPTGWGTGGWLGIKISRAASRAIICSNKNPPTK